MIVLLGVLIFIHELGHFLVAKYFNVKVETFSLGFGPKIWKFVRGETTYCISAIPFGGYVKMFGDELGGEVEPALRNRSFLHKPVYQRIAIALAGPLMNLALAFLLFVTIAFVGEQVVAPRLGDLDAKSQAYSLGFRSGDTILAINDKVAGRWDDIEQTISESQGKELSFKVVHENAEEPVVIKATPTSTEGKQFFQLGKTVGEIEGFDFMSHSSLIAVSDPKSIFGQLGFQTGDRILQVNDEPVKTFRDLQDALLAEGGAQTITFKVERYGIEENVKEPQKMDVVWDLKKIPFPDSPDKFGIHNPETFIGKVQEDAPAAMAGLKVNDHILMINDQQILTFKDIVRAVSSYKEESGPLRVDVFRDGKVKNVTVIPKMTEIKSEGAPTDKRFTIGIFPLRSPHVDYVTWRAPTFVGAFTWGAQKTWTWSYNTVLSFVLLVKGQVSPKNLGGFISIGQMASKSWQIGLDAFLKIMAIISLNLFILNLFPVPVLDGGHIVLFTIEAIKGSPLSVRKMEIAQQIGVFLLLFLLAFSLFNDFSRVLGFS